MPIAHDNLGTALWEQGNLSGAAASCRRALELKPDFANAHNNLATVLKDRGKLDEAIASFRRALDLKPDFVAAHSNLLLALQYRPGVTASELDDAHAKFERVHAAPLRAAWRPAREFPRCPATASRRVRLRRFRSAPSRILPDPALGKPQPGQCETVCYTDRILEDDLTTRLQTAAALWRNVVGVERRTTGRADPRGPHRRALGSGGPHRRQPAPDVRPQAGADPGDVVRLRGNHRAGCDGLHSGRSLHDSRRQSESFYCERVLRMPDGFLCFEPPDDAPPVSPLPAMAKGDATFAAFHNPPKITPEMVEVWARLLERLPGARLVLKYRGMDDPSVSGRLADEFAGRGSILPGWSFAASRLMVKAGGIPAGRRGPGCVSLQRLHDDLRGVVDGRAGGDVSRRDVRQPAFAQPPVQRRADGD